MGVTWDLLGRKKGFLKRKGVKMQRLIFDHGTHERNGIHQII
jgi:hypothetical protein